MQSEQVVTELIVDSRKSTAGTDSYVRDMQRAGAATEQTTQTVEHQGRALSYGERQAAAYLGGLSPIISAQNRLGAESRQAEGAIRSLDRQLMTGSITAADHAQKMALVTGRLGEVRLAAQQLAAGTLSAGQAMGGLGAAANDNRRAMDAASVASRQMQFGLTNLSFQINDVVSGLASGQDVMRIFAQQSGQIFQIFQTNNGLLGAAATSIKNMISPTTLAIGGLAALAGGFVFLVARASGSNQAIREFNVLLQGMNVQSLASAQGLEVAARGLRDVGLTAAEARKQITDVTRAGLNPAVAPQIVRAGVNLGVYLGSDQSQALTQALAGGVETATKYAVSVGAMTGAQAAFRVEMARTVPGANVLDEVLQRISQHADQMYQKSLTPLGRAVLDVRLAFANLFDTLSQSSAITGFVKDIATMAKSIEDAVKGLDRLFNMQPPDWARKILNVVNNTPVDRATATVPGSDNTQTALNFFRNQGLSEQQSAGVVGRLFAESEMNPAAVNRSSGAFGIAQWLGGRETPLAGSTDLMRQLELVWKEFQTTEAAAFKKILESTSAREAAIAMESFERAGEPAFTQKGAMFAEQIAAGGRPGGGAVGGVAAEGTAVTEQAISQARQMTAARLADAKATEGQGLRQQEFQAVLEISRLREKGLLTETELGTRQAELFAAAKTRLTNEIQNAAEATAFEITGQRNVADAYLQGSRAGLVMENSLKATTEAYTKFGEVSSAESKQFVQDRFKEISALETQNERIRNNRDLLGQRETQEQLQLQVHLSGQLPEIAQRELTLLQAKQTISRDFPFLTEQEKNNRLAMVTATADLNVKLAETQRAQQQIDSLFSSIGNTISSAIGNVIDGIFDKKKVIDWGAQLKSIASSVFSQIAQSMLIKPLTGELLGALGASPNVVNQFGTLGGSGGSSGGLGLGTLLQLGGPLKDIFGIKLGGEGGIFGNLFGGSGSGGMFSGVSNFFSGGLGGTFAHFPNAAQVAAGVGEAGISIPGSVFGSTTFGSALGGVGLGFGAGSLLNSLVGGNSTFGTIGSGLGSAIGMFGGPIGSLIGGALGGLVGGMFGNNKPSNQSAGANFDLSSFSLTAGFAGGNQQIDQATQQMAQGLQQFLAVLKETGGSLTGNVLLQHGVNTGITVDSSLPQYSGRFNLGKDPTAALQTIELALARSLTGITDTMQTVLDQTGDPAELQANIAFANSYDKLSEAAADAFKSVEDASKTTAGPFATAMQQINTIFQGLTDQANRFGLALDPINAALAEATRRLQGDFTTALTSAFNEATGVGFLNQLQDVADQQRQAVIESQAVQLGEDQATQDMINTAYIAQVNTILGELDQTQLDQVVTHFAGLNDVIVSLAQNTAVATDSTQALADAQAEAAQLASQNAQAQQQIQDYLNQLNATPSAFVSPEDALLASTQQYQQQLALAQGGDLDALSSITQYADQLIKNIETYYASSELGQSLVDEIEQQLAALLGVQGTITDPAVLTNQLLTELTTTVTAGADQTGLTITAGTQQLIDSNNAVAASTLAQYAADTATLVGVTNATAAANIAMNQAASQALIDVNNQSAAAIVAQNDAAAAQLIASNDQTTSSLIDQNDAAAAALIASNDNSTADLIAQNSASSESLISANDNSTAAMVAAADATTAAILADTSGDTTALGLVFQSVGDQLSNVMTGLANSQISATYETSSVALQSANAFANNQLTATYGTASVALSAENAFTNSQLTAIYDSVNSHINSDTALANSQIAATYGAANSLINVGATYSNAQASAIYGAAGGIVQSEAIYSNNQLIAISTASATNDNLLTQANGWLSIINNTTADYGDTAIRQRQDMVNLLTQIRDALWLGAAA